MAYLLSGDARYAEQAAALLAETTLFETFTETNEPIHTLVGQVPQYCEAYDLLRTSAPDADLTWQINDADDAAIRNHIAAMGRWLRTYRPFWYGFVYNNWAIRQYAALALCGMTISSGCETATAEEAAAWVTYGSAEALAAMDRQVCAEGAFAEGCSYLRYSAENYLSFFFARRNRFGDNLFSRPAVQATHQWLTQIRTPSGFLPNYDDSPLTSFPTHYLTSAEEGGNANELARLFAWDWQRAGAPVEDLCRSICWYDDTVSPLPPAGEPCLVLPEAGTAVFRSSWAHDAVYLLLIGEHGKPRINGYGHEHPDNTSFIIEAFGEQLAIDGGYIDFPNHALVNQPENHNLILIDGAGPFFVQVENQPLLVDQDAYLGDYEVAGRIPRCSVRTSYAGMDLRRTVLMPGRDHFVIIDQVKKVNGPGGSPGSTPPVLSWLLHGDAGVSRDEGGTDGAFQTQSGIAVWTRPSGIRLTLALLCTADDFSLRERTRPDGTYYPHQLTGHGPSSILRHRTVEGVARGWDAVYLAALLPTGPAEDAPRIEDVSTSSEMALRLCLANGRVETVRARRPEGLTPAERVFTITTRAGESEPEDSYTGAY